MLTLDGPVTVQVPPGSQAESKLYLKDKGIADSSRSGRKGNQYVVVKLQVPTSLSDRQKELLAEFAKEEEAKKKSSFSLESAWNRLKSFMGSAWCEEVEKKNATSP